MSKRSNKKLTNADVDARLDGRNIRRIGDYLGANIPISFECMICNYNWPASPSSIITKKTGCPACSGMGRMTNEYIDDKIRDRQIKRLDDCLGATVPIRFQCLIDNNIWPARPTLIINQNTGCPECAHRKNGDRRRLTQSEVDERLIPFNIKRIGVYVDTSTNTLFECLTCHYTWKTIPNSILNQNTGCNECAQNARKLTNEELDDLLIDRSIKRIDDIIDSQTNIYFECLVCHCKWKTKPGSLIYRDGGCPDCAIKEKTLTNNDIDNRLLNLNIIRLDDYINSITPINFQCLNCKFIWKTTAYSIYGKDTGCPKCDLSQAEKLIHEVLTQNNVSFVNQKKMQELDINYPNRHKVDFYIKSNNIIVEYNGTQHYKPITFGHHTDQQAEINFQKQIARDQQVEQFCKDNNINLIWIDGRKYRKVKLERFILDEVLPLLK